MEIEVQGSGNNPYKVDTEKLTCTCSDFKFRRRHYSIENEERLCKHLWQVFNNHPELKPASISKQESLEVSSGVDQDGKVRYPRQMFDQYASDVRSLLQEFQIVKMFEFCGSYRRLMPRISDLDVLIVLDPETSLPDPIFNYCEEILGYEKLWRGNKKASYKVDGFIQIDFKIVPEISWPFAICHYTGSKEENIKLRRLANLRGMTLNEYGIYKGSEFVGSDIKTEQDLYQFLNVSYKSPYER